MNLSIMKSNHVTQLHKSTNWLIRNIKLNSTKPCGKYLSQYSQDFVLSLC